MRLLLDTHVLLWYIAGDPRLPATFRAAIQEPDHAVFLSVASIWEVIVNWTAPLGPLPARPAGERVWAASHAAPTIPSAFCFRLHFAAFGGKVQTKAECSGMRVGLVFSCPNLCSCQASWQGTGSYAVWSVAKWRCPTTYPISNPWRESRRRSLVASGASTNSSVSGFHGSS